MIRFDSDYTEGCHPKVLAALTATNLEQPTGYGEDAHCAGARALILDACGLSGTEADVHFLVGGTQVNAAVIAAALRPWEGVLSAESGHIACHETGAVEATGHKVLVLPQENGKLRASDVRAAIETARGDPNAEHIVQPGLVYLSQPTEFGTLYTRAELEAIAAVCRTAALPLYLDGARLGCALAADEDLTLRDYAALCDAFTIGGTKMGLLFGEAAVLRAPALRAGFRNLMKQRGAMLAKGRLLGVQYEAMFTDGLYLACGRNAVGAARRIKGALLEHGVPLAFDSPTNQIFVTLTRAQAAALEKDFALGHWDAGSGETQTLRICTSWATTPEQTDALIEAIKTL